jgi:hypothetical protein
MAEYRVTGVTGPTGAAGPTGLHVVNDSPNRRTPANDDVPAGPSTVIALADRAQEVIEITELEPNDGAFIGKSINPDGSITPYPSVTYWRQRVARVPATIPHLFAYLREARQRNIALIRGAPANLDRQPTRRQTAGIYGREDRRDHGFIDKPTKVFFLDGDGIKILWRADPERAVRAVVAQLGEPWASTSFVWFLSATHGLDCEELTCPTTGKKCRRWTGKIVDGKLRVRLAFIIERALDKGEATELTNIAQASVGEFDASISRLIQPNYIRRPHWIEHPDRDVLGDIPTIGWVKGTRDELAVPNNLTHTARWAKAQGHGSGIADHPDTESAARGIGSDGRLREHMKAAVVHLLRANPVPDVTSFIDHSLNIADKLGNVIEQYREVIDNNLLRHSRGWSEVYNYLSGMADWAFWCLNRPGILHAKTIKLTYEEQPEKVEETREAIFARVARTIDHALAVASLAALANPVSAPPSIQELLVAPTGSRKSTLMRTAAVRFVTAHPNKTVLILMPRHKLGDEQIELLRKEHPNGKYSAAVWRGRHATDPHSDNDPKDKMCRRAEEAEAVEKAMLDVERSLCKRGRGKKAVKCPFYDGCAFQQQKRTKANIWFAAHECAVHKMPKAFGDVGFVIFDESPLDAFMFGVDLNDQVTLELDTLRTPLPVDPAKLNSALTFCRENLYHALDKIRVPIEFHQGAAVPWEVLKGLIHTALGGSVPWDSWGSLAQIIHTALSGTNLGISIQSGSARVLLKDSRNWTWRCKVKPNIRPDMPKEKVKAKLQEATVNATIKKEVLLWELIDAAEKSCGHDIRDMPVERLKALKTMLQEAAVPNRFPGNNAFDGTFTIEKEVPIWSLIDIPIHRGVSYGRIAIHRGKEGRIIRMVGLNHPAKGWNVPTLICDATGDTELLKAIWPQLVEAEPHGWEQLPRPANVRVFQCIDRAISKSVVAVEGKALEQKIDSARRLYAALLMKALEYGGADVGVIVYKSTKDWIEKNCFVPEWLKLFHWGDVTGTNALQHVRALFVIGRPLASPEAVTQQAEALFGAHIPQREYVLRPKRGRIPIVPDAAGNNCARVDVWEHPDPMAERLRRQITEGAIIQATGRARAGLRTADEPLDLHLWTDVPVPEMGPVEPVLWSELEAGPDGLMLTMEGVWLSSIADAARAFHGLFTAAGLKAARGTRGGGGSGVFPIGITKGKQLNLHLLVCFISAQSVVVNPPALCFCGRSPTRAGGWKRSSDRWRGLRLSRGSQPAGRLGGYEVGRPSPGPGVGLLGAHADTNMRCRDVAWFSARAVSLLERLPRSAPLEGVRSSTLVSRAAEV